MLDPDPYRVRIIEYGSATLQKYAFVTTREYPKKKELKFKTLERVVQYWYLIVGLLTVIRRHNKSTSG
jgi:hypothetical protein